MMLHHHPPGRSNPYERDPWGRNPLHPTDTQQVTVGAKAPEGTRHVVVEYQSAGLSHTQVCRPVEDTWQATIGPFEPGTTVRYKFRSEPGDATPWFEFRVSTWTEAPWESVGADGDDLTATFPGGELRVNWIDGHSLQWEIVIGAESSDGTGAAPRSGCSLALEGDNLRIVTPSRTWLLRPPRCLEQEDRIDAVELAWMLEAQERILGGGERYDALNQRGRTPDVRVYEQYKQQGSRSYFPTPFFVSSAGYGCYVASSGRVRSDIGAGEPEWCSLQMPLQEQSVGGYFFVGDPFAVISRYTELTGRPSPMPTWAFGPWMSGNEWNSDARVRQVVGRTLAEDIPATVIVIEAWSDETTFYLFNDATYPVVSGSDQVPYEEQRFDGRWPDPKGLVDWLHSRNVRVLLWQIPVLKAIGGHPQHEADVAFAVEHEYCVGTAGGEPYRNRGWWFPEAGVIDFTNPEARDWWFDKRAYLLESIGIDGFKTDGGEHLWGEDVVTHAGETGDAAANRYPVHYLEAYHTFLREHGHQRPVLFSRAGFTGAQRYPAHWAGDEDSTWDALRTTLTAGLSAGVSGIAFWGWDLAGFSGPLPGAELYCRATEMATFSPIMQYHSEYNEHAEPSIDRTPWNVAGQTGDVRVLEVYRWYAHLRMELVSYLESVAHEAVEEGLPMMRAMALEFPDDPLCWDVDDQYMLGHSLLIAPVLEEGVTLRSVYLPEGDWSEFWSGRRIDCGWQSILCPLDRIPVFVRDRDPALLRIGIEAQAREYRGR